jgi:hypothetical protein
MRCRANTPLLEHPLIPSLSQKPHVYPILPFQNARPSPHLSRDDGHASDEYNTG